MDDYKHILVAVDLSADAKQVISRAIDLAARYQSRVSLIHVVEPYIIDNNYDLVTGLPDDLEMLLLQQARDYVDQLSRELKPEIISRVFIEVGSVKGEIFRVTSENSVDLIVTGSHGRHGLGLLLGSTATAILHGAPCDVFVVRINKTDE